MSIVLAMKRAKTAYVVGGATGHGLERDIAVYS